MLVLLRKNINLVMIRIIYLCFLIIFLRIDINAQNKDDELINNYVENNQYKDALSHIDKLPPTLDRLFTKASCYEQLNNYLKAIALLIPLSEEYNTNKKIKLKLASCYQSLSDWDSSLL